MIRSENTHKVAYILSGIIVFLAIIASAGGLFLKGLYRENFFVTLALKANDLVTLVIAIPVLIAGLFVSRRGSQRAQLVWFGMLDYMLYNYAFYLLGAAFNWFFLLYTALFTLSIFALIFGLINIDVNSISQKFRPGTPVKWISGYMLFLAIGLSTVYIIQSINFIITGLLPPIIIKTGHPTCIVFALDLSLLVPVLVLGAIWLWKRQPWGYVLAGISLVKGATYTLVLTAGAFWVTKAGVPGASADIPLWATLNIAGMIACIFLFVNLESKKKK